MDANILVAELVRERGRVLLSDPTLRLYVAGRAWEEAEHELHKRVSAMIGQGRMPPDTGEELLKAAFAAVEARVLIVPEEVYVHLEEEARARIPRDPDDWPTVALALALDSDIWTGDGDFLGCGVAVWTTETLTAHLRR